IVFFVVGWSVAGLQISVAMVFAIGIIVANVPEGLLPTLTMALSVSTQRMADRHVLVKKLSSVETLGSTTIICTDKTGTLTANQMTVRELWMPGLSVEVSGVGYEPEGEFASAGLPLACDTEEQMRGLLAAGATCNNARLLPPGGESERWGILGDPTEAAMMVAARKVGLGADELSARCDRLFEHPFDSARKRMTVVCNAGDENVAYVKGAPRELIDRCTRLRTAAGIQPMTEEMRQCAHDANDRMARDALRVIAVAERPVGESDDFRDTEAMERDLTLLGLEGMQDPPRPEVAAAVNECHEAGIRVIMITGDYGLTAEAIARRIGLVSGEGVRVVTGHDLETMDDGALRAALGGQVVFARVVPEHKMRIAQTLQAMGEVVAMTGDGVNDAPALKAADIGIAMGRSGTDVAREASDMVLTDDNFASIVAAVEEGRAIFDNIRRFLT
ncbi:MAG: cation-transporting P-type ATPase, partial [Actinobacteria bacterium]